MLVLSVPEAVSFQNIARTDELVRVSITDLVLLADPESVSNLLAVLFIEQHWLQYCVW